MFFKTRNGAVSKTVVFNLLVLVLGVLQMLQTSPLVTPELVPYVLLGIGVVNVILRVFFTTEPIQR